MQQMVEQCGNRMCWVLFRCVPVIRIRWLEEPRISEDPSLFEGAATESLLDHSAYQHLTRTKIFSKRHGFN